MVLFEIRFRYDSGMVWYFLEIGFVYGMVIMEMRFRYVMVWRFKGC